MKKIVSIKGFDKDLRCRGYQFEVGKTYTHDGVVKVCESGFHAVEYGIDAFSYYAPADSVYCVVEHSGETKRHSGDTKIASASITIKAEIKIPQLVQQSVDWIMSQSTSTKTESNTGNRSAATNTGYQSAATNTGDWSAATVEGQHSVAVSTGFYGKAKACQGSAIVLVNRNNKGEIVHIRCAIAGKDIEADVFYMLNDDGDFVKEGE
jgi:hypothetical protein